MIIIPFAVIAGIGFFSGMYSSDPGDMSGKLGLMMTLYMLIVGVVSVLFQPLVIVTMGTHVLSLIEGKKATGLMSQVENMDLGAAPSPYAPPPNNA